MALDASNQGTVLWSLDIDGSPLLSGTLSRMPVGLPFYLLYILLFSQWKQTGGGTIWFLLLMDPFICTRETTAC